jgi:hypothetical protein
MKANKVPMQEQEFVRGLEKFLSMLRTDSRFDELEIKGGSTKSIKLIWHDDLVGRASHEGELARFDPRVAREPVGISVEMVFADWAGAALRRARLKGTGGESRRRISPG